MLVYYFPAADTSHRGRVREKPGSPRRLNPPLSMPVENSTKFRSSPRSHSKPAFGRPGRSGAQQRPWATRLGRSDRPGYQEALRLMIAILLIGLVGTTSVNSSHPKPAEPDSGNGQKASRCFGEILPARNQRRSGEPSRNRTKAISIVS